MDARTDTVEFALSISYLEVYNETIRDLLAPDSGALALREANGCAQAAGLSTKDPSDAFEVLSWIHTGNANRATNHTDANATSSRSHAVLSVNVSQRPRAAGLTQSETRATLSVIDLAGSERASATRNHGERLVEGANINRSLLALGNCINALCDPRKRGHVPYRDSKLTRLLKPSLGGNCKTAMIVCVSPSSAHYDETHNTLQYANRAKEIKTKVIRNVVAVDRHVGQYVKCIVELRARIDQLEKEHNARAGDSLDKLVAVERKARSDADDAARRATDSLNALLPSVNVAERARTKLAALERIIAVLRQWRAHAALSESNSKLESASPSRRAVVVLLSEHEALAAASATFDSHLSQLEREHRALANDSRRDEHALSSHRALLASLTRSLAPSSSPASSAGGDLASVLFNSTARMLDGALSSERSSSRATALAEVAKSIASSCAAIGEVRATLASACLGAVAQDSRDRPALESALARCDFASRDAFATLSGASITSATSASTSAPPTSAPSATTTTTMTTTTTARQVTQGSMRTSVKRSSGTRSPLEADSTGDSSTTSEQHTGARKATATRSAKQPRVSLASTSRRSPRKAAFGGPRAGGILKAQGGSSSPRRTRSGAAATSTLRRAAIANNATATAPANESADDRKGVQWRDETGDGWELEDVVVRSNTTTDASELSSASIGSSSNTGAGSPVHALNDVPTPMRNFPSSTTPVVNPFAAQPPPPPTAAAQTTSEMLAASMRQRSSALGSLKSRAAVSRPLTSVSEAPPAPTGFSFLAGSAGASTSKAGLSMAGTSSGLFAPIVSSVPEAEPAATRPSPSSRRESLVGPQRSAKSSRRSSFMGPPPPAGQNAADTSAETSTSSAPSGRVLKAARAATSAPAPHRSPRKVRASQGGSTARSTSGSATAPFMSKTAQRAAMRRESTAAPGTASVSRPPMLTSLRETPLASCGPPPSLSAKPLAPR